MELGVCSCIKGYAADIIYESEKYISSNITKPCDACFVLYHNNNFIPLFCPLHKAMTFSLINLYDYCTGQCDQLLLSHVLHN